MKKFFTLLMLAILVVVTACNKPNEEGGGGGKDKETAFTATAPSFSSGPAVAWAAGDQIAVYADTEKYVLSADAAGTTATFKGKVASVTTYYAATPASSFTTAAGSSVSGTLPAKGFTWRE